MRVAVAASLIAVLVAGCGGGVRAAKAPASASDVSSPWVPAAKYNTTLQNVLASASDSVEAALAKNDATAVSAATRELEQTSRRVSALRAPRNARRGDSLLVAGLRRWARELRSSAAAYARCSGAAFAGPDLVERGFTALADAGYLLRQRSRRGLGVCARPRPPMGRSAYLSVVKHELVVSGPTIDAALTAQTSRGLEARVATAKRALRAAADRLDGLRPPPAAVKANDLLVLGLDEWASEIELAAATMYSRIPETITRVSNAMRGPETLARAASELRRAGFRVSLG